MFVQHRQSGGDRSSVTSLPLLLPSVDDPEDHADGAWSNALKPMRDIYSQGLFPRAL